MDNEIKLKKSRKLPDTEGWWAKIDSWGEVEMVLIYSHQDDGLQVRFETDHMGLIHNSLNDWLERLDKNEYEWAGPILLEWE